MIFRKTLNVLLVLSLLLSFAGCSGKTSNDGYWEKILQMEQTDQKSPISGVRTGVWAQGTSLGDNEFECTDDGIYYLCNHVLHITDYDDNGNAIYSAQSFLFYSDHGSDTMIKLCGRADCLHEGEGCNAYFDAAIGGVSYYNGYLYVAENTMDEDLLALYRLDLDGGNRVKVMDCSAVSEGYSGWSRVMVTNGVFTFVLSKLDATSGQQISTYFYYKLDGSMNEPEPLENVGFPVGNDGQNFMTLAGSIACQYDIESGTRRELFDVSEYGYAYYGAEASYVLDGNAVTKLNHTDGQKEILFEINLPGSYTPRFFPDCIVLIEQLESTEAERNPKFYFYSWEGEFLGELIIDFPHTTFLEGLIGGETKERIMLRTSIASIPEYYIEKSDFGTGNIEIHKFEYPDLDEETYTAIFGEE